LIRRGAAKRLRQADLLLGLQGRPTASSHSHSRATNRYLFSVFSVTLRQIDFVIFAIL